MRASEGEQGRANTLAAGARIGKNGVPIGGTMRSSFHTRSVLALLAFLVLASTAYSQTESAKDKDKEKEKKRTRADVFQELDRNGDDMLTPAEWPGNERSFRHMDA